MGKILIRSANGVCYCGHLRVPLFFLFTEEVMKNGKNFTLFYSSKITHRLLLCIIEISLVIALIIMGVCISNAIPMQNPRLTEEGFLYFEYKVRLTFGLAMGFVFLALLFVTYAFCFYRPKNEE